MANSPDADQSGDVLPSPEPIVRYEAATPFRLMRERGRISVAVLALSTVPVALVCATAMVLAGRASISEATYFTSPVLVLVGPIIFFFEARNRRRE